MNHRQQCFEMLLTYIEAHLDTPIDVASLSSQLHLSPFHFHRQCSAYFGVSVMQLVRLLRLKRAAWQLIYRQTLSVTDIALAAGYDSVDGFSRAFKQCVKQSPAAFRRQPDWHRWQQHFAAISRLRERATTKTLRPQDVELIDWSPLAVACLRHQGPPQQLGRSIQAFIAWRQSRGLTPTKSRTFNILYGDPDTMAPADFRLDLCCTYHQPLSPDDLPVMPCTLGDGLYVRLPHRGSDQELGHSIDAILNQWIPTSGYQLREALIFIERQQFFPDVAEGNALSDIYMPVAPVQKEIEQ